MPVRYFDHIPVMLHTSCRLTIAVYTCSKSCVPADGNIRANESPAYAEEFVFVQPAYTEQ